MTPLEELNNANWIFLEELCDSGSLILEFTLSVGRTVEEESFVEVGESKIGPVNEVITDSNSPKFKITFEEYVAFNVLNESYDNMSFKENVKGKSVKICSDSNYLDYVRSESLADQIIEEPLRHFYFFTQSHLINVISTKEPKVEKLNITQ